MTTTVVVESPREEHEALQTLQTSPGWQLFQAMIEAEIHAEFEEHITRALDVPEATLSMDRMRQIAAVRRAGQRWLAWPKHRCETLQTLSTTRTVNEFDKLTENARRFHHAVENSRRGGGL